ncbi:hypothetical protein HK102_005755, partial [Quaeritorhiza haematococci]
MSSNNHNHHTIQYPHIIHPIANHPLSTTSSDTPVNPAELAPGLNTSIILNLSPNVQLIHIPDGFKAVLVPSAPPPTTSSAATSNPILMTGNLP